MVSVTKQRDIILEFKKEISLNVGILSKLHALPSDLCKLPIDNALEKPTQSFFNHLSRYLICLIDSQAGATMSWPLYDSMTERAYRNEVSVFINEYSKKGLLSPVMSSYLVNPGCYKVSLLMLQLSQLAIQKFLKSKMNVNQKVLYDEVTENCKCLEPEEFMEKVERETICMQSKFTRYIMKRKTTESIAEGLRNKISEMDSTLSKVNAQKYLDGLVDGYIKKQSLDDNEKAKIEQIKDVNRPAVFFDEWLLNVDKEIANMESKWSEKVTHLLQLSVSTKSNMESLIARLTGEADKNSYTIEYNHETDQICTKDLQEQVDVQQKYILRNLVNEKQLHFPNLIRSFFIAVRFILKDAEIDDNIYKFNEYLEGGGKNYSEMVKTLKYLVVRVNNAEAKLQPTPLNCQQSVLPKEITLIPDPCCIKQLQCHETFDALSPLSKSKHQFNLRRNNFDFVKPLPKSEIRVNPIFFKPNEHFVKINVRYEPPVCNNYLDVTVASSRANETIAECSTGFTKQQILRLLSTKKSTKNKMSRKSERSDSFKRAGTFNDTDKLDVKKVLFNESTSSTESLFRSYSSPNLFEHREMRNKVRAQRRKLSIKEEQSPTNLNVSGIMALDKDSGCETTQNVSNVKLLKVPLIVIEDQKFHENIKNFRIDLENILDSPKETVTPKSAEVNNKTGSLEKLISRYRKIRATVTSNDENGCHTITEEKESSTDSGKVKTNRVLLPDLLDTSPNIMDKSVGEILVDFEDNACKKTRQSLGTVLGVDETFLDQFTLVDD